MKSYQQSQHFSPSEIVTGISHNDISQSLSLGYEPAPDQQTDGKQDCHDGQPVPTPPPQGQQEAHADYDAGDLASNDVETAEYEQGADQGRAQIARRERDGVLAALHVRDAALTGVEGDGFDVATSEHACDGVAELVKGDDQHLIGTKG